MEGARKEQGAPPLRTHRSTATIEAMCSEPSSDRVWIEIDPAADPISGVVRHGSDHARAFSGWLELVALLESERRPDANPNSPADPA